ncbi:MAG: type II toxin-antitoxin system HipA family toxin [Chitinispirillales bacterium]|jgi:serine/threonine-protein kinase HipA|nr:type II toxin-antitoxin system HipA family toxin [Chitinispirillales bacterium]
MQNKLLNIAYDGRTVGRLAETPEKVLAFEYGDDWLREGFSISPFNLPLEKRVFIADATPFGGSFGVFNDSLPDGWGRLLIDRLLLKRQIEPRSVSLIDRLAIVGTTGTGALEYRPAEDLMSNGYPALDMDVFAMEAKRIQADEDSNELEKMVRGSGSSNGARPKMFWRDADGSEWLVKFPAHNDPKSIGKLEFDYMAAAKLAGLIVPETRLFNGKYFGAHRFDRKPDGQKIFMISASGLLDVDHRNPVLDYNHLMQATLSLTRDFREVERMFRLMCFNVFSHNRDDHAKNFSFLYDDGRWQLSPAYDLVYNTGLGITGEHATMIDGEGHNPTEKHILSVAQKAGMNRGRAEKVMDEVKNAAKGVIKTARRVRGAGKFY